ncbi:MAG: hypothetical protein N4A33_02335 [Bacteriovoracaceae bacterium]|jgi:predicted O-methyltransferase YrrM|nr:hypothetical protein [Bacteriovoracaceae bacterium]
MKNYPLSFEMLHKFSKSAPYTSFSDEEKRLFDRMISLQASLNFPAVHEDVGSFLSFFSKMVKAKTIFEFGSGYGGSAFWFLFRNTRVDKIYLTEKREDLFSFFESLPWKDSDLKRIDYFQGDAFEKLEGLSEKIDIVLIDGTKADYLSFLKKVRGNLHQDSCVIIDNSYWRGSFLDSNFNETNKSAINIKQLHDFLYDTTLWDSVFIPYVDGVTLVRPLF